MEYGEGMLKRPIWRLVSIKYVVGPVWYRVYGRARKQGLKARDSFHAAISIESACKSTRESGKHGGRPMLADELSLDAQTSTSENDGQTESVWPPTGNLDGSKIGSWRMSICNYPCTCACRHGTHMRIVGVEDRYTATRQISHQFAFFFRDSCQAAICLVMITTDSGHHPNLRPQHSGSSPKGARLVGGYLLDAVICRRIYREKVSRNRRGPIIPTEGLALSGRR